MGIQNFKMCKRFFNSLNFINYSDNFKIKKKFITSQLILRSNLIWFRPASACSPTPQRAQTAGVAELWRPCHPGEVAAPCPGCARHAMQARALRPRLVVAMAQPLPASHCPPSCQVCDTICLSDRGAPTAVRPRGRRAPYDEQEGATAANGPIGRREGRGGMGCGLL